MSSSKFESLEINDDVTPRTPESKVAKQPVSTRPTRLSTKTWPALGKSKNTWSSIVAPRRSAPVPPPTAAPQPSKPPQPPASSKPKASKPQVAVGAGAVPWADLVDSEEDEAEDNTVDAAEPVDNNNNNITVESTHVDKTRQPTGYTDLKVAQTMCARQQIKDQATFEKLLCIFYDVENRVNPGAAAASGVGGYSARTGNDKYTATMTPAVAETLESLSVELNGYLEQIQYESVLEQQQFMHYLHTRKQLPLIPRDGENDNNDDNNDDNGPSSSENGRHDDRYWMQMIRSIYEQWNVYCEKVLVPECSKPVFTIQVNELFHKRKEGKISTPVLTKAALKNAVRMDYSASWNKDYRAPNWHRLNEERVRRAILCRNAISTYGAIKKFIVLTQTPAGVIVAGTEGNGQDDHDYNDAEKDGDGEEGEGDEDSAGKLYQIKTAQYLARTVKDLAVSLPLSWDPERTTAMPTWYLSLKAFISKQKRDKMRNEKSLNAYHLSLFPCIGNTLSIVYAKTTIDNLLESPDRGYPVTRAPAFKGCIGYDDSNNLIVLDAGDGNVADNIDST